MSKLTFAGVLAATLLAVSFTAAQAADKYPSHTITMIVPYAAGGPSDVVARIMADGMSKALGETIIVENIGGAGGTIGTTRAADAKPDGYTVLAASMGSLVSAPTVTPNVRYDSVKDFQMIGLTANAPVAVVARKDFPAKDLKEFIAYIKAHGDNVKQAHGGIGSSSHMACLLFATELGLKPQLIAYRGTGPALNDLVGGHVDYFCEQIVSVAPAVQGNLIRGYVVSGDQRSSALPDLPSAKEAGIPKYGISIWSAIFAPKGTPKDVVAKLAGALDKTLDDPAIGEKLAKLGGTVPPKAQRGPEQLEKLLTADIARWNPILKSAMAEMKK
ncbi:MAG: tripartite tricarboxylate transporter substrate-binding protein [Pseudolabrys sp.]|jgi:tripartite-type tricarboxylate transporter receptor subunit TctC